MAISNIKIASATVQRLKRLTGQATGQKAVHTAIRQFFTHARRRKTLKALAQVSFQKHFDPLKLRSHDR